MRAWAGRVVAILGVVAALSMPRTALAAPDDTTRLAARTLGEAGLALYEKGDFAGALEKFERALALVQVPTLGVRTARCLAKLGRLVEASERYRQVGAMTIDTQAPAAFQRGQADAQAEAEAERAALLPRIPTIEPHLEGDSPARVVVTLDDKPLPPASLGLALPVDPGTHRLSARRDAEVVTEIRNMAEGAHDVVVLRLQPPLAVPGAAPIVGRPPTPPAAVAPPPASVGRTVGFVMIGAGAAGLAVWAGTFGAAASKEPALNAACPNQVCHGDSPALDSYNGLKLAATGALVTGVVLAAAGIVTVLVAPRPSAKPNAARWNRALAGGLAF